MIIGFLFGGRGSRGDDSGGGWWAVTHQTQVPLGLIRAPIHLEVGTAVASMAVVRLMTGSDHILFKPISPCNKVTPLQFLLN